MRFFTKPITALAAFLAAALLAWYTPTPAHEVVSGNAVPDRDLPAWVRQRVEQWQIHPAERPFDQIGWAKDIRAAERLAKQYGRPVFLFTYDGAMAIGRC